jgi:hypothetical protein
MTLLSPALALAGLTAIVVPILIHLLSRRRRRPLEWAAMQFLLQAFRKHNRRVRLRQWILLALRCLILLLLGLALARPLLKHAAGELFASERMIFLLIDNSLTSSLQQDDGGNTLDRHIKDAVDIIRALNPGDSVAIITTAGPAEGLLLPPSSDHSSAVRLLRSLQPSQSHSDLPGAFTILRDALEINRGVNSRRICYLLSAFRTGSANLTEALPRVPVELSSETNLFAVRPAQHAVHNVRVTAFEPVRRLMLSDGVDISGQVRIILARSGDELPAEVTRLWITGPDLPRTEPQIIRWRPGQDETTVDVVLEPGVQGNREISLTAVIDDDRLQGDNRFYTIITMRQNIRVVLLDRHEFGGDPMVDRFTSGQWLRRALEPGDDSPIQVIDVEPAVLAPADLEAVDVVMVSRPDLLTEQGWGLMRRFVDDEGLLIVIPPGEANVHEWTENFTTILSLPWQIGSKTVGHPDGLGLATRPGGGILNMISGDLEDLMRPVTVQRNLPVDLGESGDRCELVLDDGSPVLIVGRAGRMEDDAAREAWAKADDRKAHRGLVVLMTVAPELSWTNLPSKPLMVPLVQEIIRQGLSDIWSKRGYVAGERPVIASGARIEYVASPDGQRVPIGDDDRPARALGGSGIYRACTQAGHQVMMVAVNVDPDAGRTDIQSSPAVASWLAASGPWVMLDPGESSLVLQETTGKVAAAVFLLILVLLLIALETVLARRFSYAYREGVGDIKRGLQPTIEEHLRPAFLRSGPQGGSGS